MRTRGEVNNTRILVRCNRAAGDLAILSLAYFVVVGVVTSECDPYFRKIRMARETNAHYCYLIRKQTMSDSLCFLPSFFTFTLLLWSHV